MRIQSTCITEGCDRLVQKRQWCEPHYRKYIADGGERVQKERPRISAEARFFAKIRLAPNPKRDDLGDCWIWTAFKSPDGYGRFGSGGSGNSVPSYRWAYEHWVGPVPEGKVLDHFACDNPACANPHHVRPVNFLENVLRSDVSLPALNLAKTHCINGHEFTPENTYQNNGPGTRSCRTCVRARASARYEEIRAARTPAPPKTHCKHGHEFTEANTWIDKKGWRHCKACNNEASNKRYHAKKDSQAQASGVSVES